jgi:hypothetical protein
MSAAGWVSSSVVASALAGFGLPLEVIILVVRWYRRLPALLADCLAAARPTWVSPQGLVTDTAMAAISAISAQTRAASTDRGSRIPLKLVSPAAATTALIRTFATIQ